jgi:hypothetical protein
MRWIAITGLLAIGACGGGTPALSPTLPTTVATQSPAPIATAPPSTTAPAPTTAGADSKAIAVHLVNAIDELQALSGDVTEWALPEGQWAVDNIDSAHMAPPAIAAYMDAMGTLLADLQAGVDTGPAVAAILATRPALAAMAPGAVGMAPPTPAPAKPVVVKGTGSQKTKPFNLAAGDFTVTISGRGNGNVIVDLNLRSAPAYDGETLFNEIAYAKYKYSTVAYGLAGGSYYLDLAIDNAWVVTFTPLP